MDQPNRSEVIATLPPLPDGAVIGSYILARLISSGPDGNTYLAHTRADAVGAYQVIEYPAGEQRSLAALARLRLDHPALLAPREALTLGARAYLILPLPTNAQPIGALPPEDALRQIIIVGEALAYLHSQGVAHLRVQPASIMLVDGEARLGGLEDAQIVRANADDARLLFERDANFLALTLVRLAASDSSQQTNTPLDAALGKIREHGISHSYQSVAQVITDCQQALAPLQRAAHPASQPPDFTWTVHVGHATSIGLVRPNNEDALGHLLLNLRDGQGQSRLLACFVVADGMGGEARGEVASHLAAQHILEQVTRRLALPLLQGADAPQWTSAADALERERLMREALVEGFRSANRQIRLLARAHGQTIGTTATALLICASQALIAHVGDSRAYRLHRGVLAVLTEDHSYVQRLIQLGQIDPTNQAHLPRRNDLYRALGKQDDLDIDLVACPLEAGDRLLLCSDGLWDAVPESTLAALLADQDLARAPTVSAARLVALANEAGGLDNSTAIVLEITGEPVDRVGS